MQDDVAPFGDRALEVDALARVLLGHPLEVRDECLLAIGHMGIVLDVAIAHHTFRWLLPPAR
jgi:hypothetical protein